MPGVLLIFSHNETLKGNFEVVPENLVRGPEQLANSFDHQRRRIRVVVEIRHQLNQANSQLMVTNAEQQGD